MIESIWQDIRHAARSLRRSPGFTAVVILTLALGTGVNVAIFSVIDHALLRPLPVPDPEQLVNLSAPGPKTGATSANSEFGGSEEVFSYPLFRDLERVKAGLTGIAAHRDFEANIAFKGQASHATGLLVSGNYFPVLGVQPALGRLLSPDDDRVVGSEQVAVIGYDYWRTRFGASPSVLNNALIVNGWLMTIVGVTPPDFPGTTLDKKPDVFVPLTTAALMRPGWNGFDDRRDHWLYLFGRLAPGLTVPAASRLMDVPFAAIINDLELPAQRSGLSATARETFARRQLRLEPGAQGQRPNRDELNRLALLLLCATVSVLLMACANVANLLLTRGISRMSATTVRIAIGASRLRLLRQLLIESALLALAGALAGVVLAMWAVGAVTPLLPGAATFRFELDSALLLVGMCLSGATVVLISVFPALYSTRPDLAIGLRSNTAPTGAAPFRTALTTLQLALSLVMVVFAGLFTMSLSNVRKVDLGIHTENLLTFRIRPELNGYSRDRARALARRIEQELSSIPGVASISTSTIPLLDGFGWSSNVTVDGSANVPASPYTADVGPGYFRTVGIPLVAGREFLESDYEGSPRVAIVNESLVRTLNLGNDVLGRRIGIGSGNIPLDIEIVGVVRDARYSHVKEPAPPQFYLPYRQIQRFRAVNFYVRSIGPLEPLLSVIPRRMAQIDSGLPVENLLTMRDQARADEEADRSLTILSSAFAGLAIVLAAIGLYGVLSYAVAQRRREMGVRMALGANAWRITRLVFGHALRVTLVGGIMGGAAALALATVARSMLFGIEGLEPGVIALSVAIVTTVALIAAVFPAIRAARVDPMTVLRAE